MIIINALANILPIGIGRTGDISAKYQNMFTPAPYTFSIWGIIYILMLLFVLYQWNVFGDKSESTELITNLGPLFAISCAINIAWIFTWHNDRILLSTIMITGLLISLIFIQLFTDMTVPSSTVGKIVTAGFDLYLGWIIAAVIANISVLTVSLNWNHFGLSEETWTIMILVIGAAIGILPTLIRQNYLSTIGVIWAYFGIVVKHLSSTGFNSRYTGIIITALIGITIMIAAMLFSAITLDYDIIGKEAAGFVDSRRHYPRNMP